MVLALLVLCVPLSGCLSDPAGDNPNVVDDRLRLEDRHLVEWNWTGSQPGAGGRAVHRTPGAGSAIEVDTSDIWETGPPTSEVHLSYWLPPTSRPVSRCRYRRDLPYYSYGPQGSESSATNVVSPGRGEFIFDNMRPTAMPWRKSPCSAPRKAADVSTTEGPAGPWHPRGRGVAWPAGVVQRPRRPVRKSYEGATQWEAAAMGSEYLKTIVPISARPPPSAVVQERSAEARSQVMHMNYFSSTVDYNGDDLDNICPDIVEGLFADP